MRRKEKEITDLSVIEDIILKAQVCRIGMCDDGIPYVVPMNFGYSERVVYFHCAKEGMKLNVLQKNNNVCFEVEDGYELVTGKDACGYSAKYCSVIGTGKATIVKDTEEKIKALNIIMEHYTGRTTHEFSEKAVESLEIIKIELEKITGKKSGY